MNTVTSKFLQRGNPEMQDRSDIVTSGNRIVFIVADGAGGISGGAEAAELFLRSVQEAASQLTSEENCAELLRNLDQKIAQTNGCGETTGVVMVVQPGSVLGASVGDSAAWLFTPNDKRHLTEGARKPFIGSGAAWPHQFTQDFTKGTLVVATDGLWKYTSLESIEQKTRAAEPDKLATELSDLVRLRSGAFQDDIAIATCHIQ